MLPKTVIGANLGTPRFQRAVSAGGALGINGPSNRDCTLEARRALGAPPNLCAGFNMRPNTYGSPNRRNFGFAEPYLALAYQISTLSITLSRPRRSITRVLPPALILFLIAISSSPPLP